MEMEIDKEILIEALIEAITEKVIEKITPLINANAACDKDKDELIDIDTVALYLKKTKASIYSKTHTRSIPFLKYGKQVLFSKKDVDLWLKNPYSPELEVYNLNHGGRKARKT